MKNLLLFLILTFTFSSSVLSQDKASINSWRGLVIDETTFEQAKGFLGDPMLVGENEIRDITYFEKS